MLYSDHERQIYSCPVTQRSYDPLAVRRSLTIETRNKFGALIDAARSDDPTTAAQAETQLIAAARKAFSFPAIDPVKGSGVLDAVVWEALIAYTKWLAGKGVTERTTPAPSPCSGCQKRAAMRNGSASSSTSKPEPLPSPEPSQPLSQSTAVE